MITALVKASHVGVFAYVSHLEVLYSGYMEPRSQVHGDEHITSPGEDLARPNTH